MSGHKAKLSDRDVMRVFEHQRDVTTVELANALSVDLSAAHWWRRTLAERGQIVPGSVRPSPKAGGRSSQAWQVAPTVRGARPAQVRLGDRVVTPSGRVAVVVDDEDDGRLDLEYVGELGERLEGGAIVVLPPALCAVWRKNQPRPEPVKVRFE